MNIRVRLVFCCISLFLAIGGAIAEQRALVPVPAAVQASEPRVALLIGNSAYKISPLKNPKNDATDLAETLKRFGFKTILRIDASQRDMKRAVREFRNELRQGGVGLFYYAGHGIQVKGRNYLVPVTAEIDVEADVEDESLDANYVLGSMEEAGNRVNIVILDACRNNPFTGSFRSAARGLVAMDTAARGTFFAYATAPGSVAADGNGRNGIYTKHLLAALQQPDSDIEKVFKRVRANVAAETRNAQIPWDSSSLLGDFRFNVKEIQIPAPASETQAGASTPKKTFTAPRF